MTRWLLSVAVLGLVGCSTDVRGFVRDGDTGEPLRGATIRSGDQTVETDATGFYELEDVEEDDDEARIYISKPGYEPRTEVIDVDDVDEVDQDIELDKAER